MRHEQLKNRDSFDLVDPARAATAVAHARTISGTTPAVPDVPAALGVISILLYSMIVGFFALTIANKGFGLFIIGIDIAFLAAFFSVPALFLKFEGDTSRRPSLDRFLSQGMQTYTGPVTAKGAMAQMFVVPALLAFAALAIGMIATFA